ncbi:MAG: hypothetical protein J6A68_02775, partial [Oscillospiraceae bacterium]|nr:hypothetical protein [Oscillospiraceae bacterium]
RGDCINSLGWTFGAKNKEGSFKSYVRPYTRLFTKEDIELFYQFRKRYHSKSNFIILPRGLNKWRGEYRGCDNDNYGYGTCDYFDILLDLIRKYYFQEPMSTRMRSYVDPYKNWLNTYGCGESGWRAFIKRNYLMPFVNDKYLVKDIFADNNSYKNNECDELIGRHHDFDWCLPRCSKNGEEILLNKAKERVVNYMKNSLWIWDERSNILIQTKNNRKARVSK